MPVQFGFAGVLRNSGNSAAGGPRFYAGGNGAGGAGGDRERIGGARVVAWKRPVGAASLSGRMAQAVPRRAGIYRSRGGENGAQHLPFKARRSVRLFPEGEPG